MSRRFDSIFEDEDNKAYMTFKFRNCGKTVTLDNKYDYDVTWNEILEDVVQCLEGHYGYSFNIKDFSIYTGKSDE
tara:strand:- start:243 stop:467 length:225 start_codon:yes stop_codon:yes gene_type:complete